MLTVKQLKEIIADLPDDMEVIYDCCSDYEAMNPEDVKLVSAVPKGGWHMRSHPTMSEDNKSKQQQYLHFPGN